MDKTLVFRPLLAARRGPIPAALHIDLGKHVAATHGSYIVRVFFLSLIKVELYAMSKARQSPYKHP